MLIDVNICVNRVNKCQKEVKHICSFKWSELSYQENKSNYSSFKGNWIDLGRENNGRTLIIYILNNIDLPFPLILYYDGGNSFLQSGQLMVKMLSFLWLLSTTMLLKTIRVQLRVKSQVSFDIMLHMILNPNNSEMQNNPFWIIRRGSGKVWIPYIFP